VGTLSVVHLRFIEFIDMEMFSNHVLPSTFWERMLDLSNHLLCEATAFRKEARDYLFDVVEDGNLTKVSDRMFLGLGVSRNHELWIDYHCLVFDHCTLRSVRR
jgi:hypothetical protein